MRRLRLKQGNQLNQLCLLCSAELCRGVQFSVVLWCALQYCAVLYDKSNLMLQVMGEGLLYHLSE